MRRRAPRGTQRVFVMPFLLARKRSMSQVYRGDEVVPVTILDAPPCAVTQVRTIERDGYAAVQVGAGTRRRITKPLAGHLRNAGMLRWLREFTVHGPHEWTVGARIDASAFKPGDHVKVRGVSKGKGFQGVVKRHRFHGQDATHGTKDQIRMPGSISGIGRGGGGPVNKGKRMAGRMGGDRVTIRGLEVIAVDPERATLVIRGAVPGARGALLEVRTDDGSWR